MDVIVDGKPYVLAAGKRFDWGYAQQLSDAFRTTGTPTRQDNKLISRLPLRWDKGIGFSRQDRETGYGVGGLRDADADTFHRKLTLPHLQQAVTGPTNGIHQAWFTFRGELYSLSHNTSATFTVFVAQFQASADDYSGGTANIQQGATAERSLEAVALAEHKGKLYALYTLEQGDFADMAYDIESSPDGTTWSDASGTGFPATTQYRVNDGIAYPAESGYRFGSLLDAPTTTRHDLIATIREEAAAAGGSVDQTRIYHSADAGSNWTNTANVGGDPRGAVMWVDPYTVGFPVAPYISTTQNVYQVDPANTQAFPLFKDIAILAGDDDDGLMAVGADGNLYVASAVGDIFRCSVETGQLSIVNIGPVTRTAGGGDGLVADRRGPVTAMVAGPASLFVAFQGATYSHILRLRYSDLTWHSFFIHDNNEKIYQMALSGADDGTMRLHIALDVGSSLEFYQFERPEESLAVITAATEVAGYVEFAEDDMFDPNNDSGLFKAVMAASGLSATTSNEYVEFYSDDQDGDWGDTDRGDFLSGDKDLLYASGVGISAKTAKHRIVLHRDAGTNTDTPKIDDLEVQVVNSQSVLRNLLLPINMTKTAERYARSIETQVTDLETIAKAATQVTVKIGKMSEFYAVIKDPPALDLEVKQADDQMDEGRLEGVALVRFTQLLEGE